MNSEANRITIFLTFYEIFFYQRNQEKNRNKVKSIFTLNSVTQRQPNCVYLFNFAVSSVWRLISKHWFFFVAYFAKWLLLFQFFNTMINEEVISRLKRRFSKDHTVHKTLAKLRRFWQEGRHLLHPCDSFEICWSSWGRVHIHYLCLLYKGTTSNISR